MRWTGFEGKVWAEAGRAPSAISKRGRDRTQWHHVVLQSLVLVTRMRRAKGAPRQARGEHRVGVIDNDDCVVIIVQHEGGQSLIDERHVLEEDAFVEIVVWRVPQTVKRSAHRLKYRLAFVVAGECVLRYDNEAGKGDHKHVGGVEMPYAFRGPEQLLNDFWSDVETWRRRR